MKKRKLSADDTAILILFTAMIFGTWLRITPAWSAGFPINDGGMFYTMIQDLQAHHYALPHFTTYNHLDIPFVYPPLGFYIGAIITDLFNFTSPLPVIQWLPGIFNSLCIPAFFLLAKEISGNKLQAAISTLVFALIPHMTAWFSMGGGLTRALGAFFMLLALTYIYRVFSEDSKKDILGAIIFSSLATLSHTEAPIYTIAIAIYIWTMKSRSQKGLISGILIAAGVLVLTSPWLVWIIDTHGFTPLLSASQTSLRSTWSVLRLLNIDFITEERYLDLLGAMGIIGMAVLVSRKNFFIPGMLVVIFLSHPRSAHTIGNIPLAMAAGFLIVEILLPAISNKKEAPEILGSKLQHSTPLFFFVLISYALSNSLYYENLVAKKYVSEAERTAMQWAKENTPAESTFLIITGEVNGFCDSTSEWFPALTNRQSLATLQGNEWLKGNRFVGFVGDIQRLQACANSGIDCLTWEAGNFASDFNYLYISQHSPTVDCNLTNASESSRSLILELARSTQFQSVFSSAGTSIFIKR